MNSETYTTMMISIHALRAEGDLSKSRKEDKALTISIHALRAEGDFSATMSASLSRLFLSTPSVRRATTALWSWGLSFSNFYPRPPCGGRLLTWLNGDLLCDFYPRPPCGGRPRQARLSFP